MVLRRRPIQQKKLCPRCGTPMVGGEEGVKSCPACYYSERTSGESKVGIRIPDEVMFEKKEESKESPIKIYQVVQDNIVSVNCLDSDTVCLVTHKKQNKIWIWKGKYTSPGEVYRAGTAATRLKASEKMYGAHTEMVSEGEEPGNFPNITGVTPEVVSQASAEVTQPEPEISEPVPEITEKKTAEVEKKEVEFEIVKLNEDKELEKKNVKFKVD